MFGVLNGWASVVGTAIVSNCFATISFDSRDLPLVELHFREDEIFSSSTSSFSKLKSPHCIRIVFQPMPVTGSGFA
jgi:hypothetical protein